MKLVPLAVYRQGKIISPRLIVRKANQGKLRSSETSVELSAYVYVTFPETVESSTSDDTGMEAEKYRSAGTKMV